MAGVYPKISFFHNLDGGLELDCDLESFVAKELEGGSTIFISGEKGCGKSSWARSFFPTYTVVTDFGKLWKASNDLILDDFDPEEYVDYDWKCVREFFAFGRVNGVANIGGIIIVSDIGLDEFIDTLVKIFGTQRADAKFVDQVNDRTTEIFMEEYCSLGAAIKASQAPCAEDHDEANGLGPNQSSGGREHAPAIKKIKLENC